MESVFWISVAFLAYVYVGYPLLLAAYTRLARRPACHPHFARAQRRDDFPGVSIIIAARN